MKINNKYNNIKIEEQAIQIGSAHILKKSNQRFDRVKHMIENMSKNKAYYYYIKNKNLNDEKGEILLKFKNDYLKYRTDWNLEANKQYSKNINFLIENNQISNPLCIDIELASICDLACPHCFREHIMTPDKIMSEKLFKKIIDEISLMNVPSIKLNWRGEPLLHPKLSDFINYAKEKKILEIIINTNATNLDEKTSEKLIYSGLDQVIFSFDGGTIKTYEKLRPGRFKENTFERVYNNIKNFKNIRDKLNSPFPTTKIQMVLTDETRNEINNFFELFDGYVDDITVLQYNERGGEISSIENTNQQKIKSFLSKKKLGDDTPFMVTADGEIYISKGRRPCEQLFQRLMITYDGKVGMCCHDWGATHCIGYVDEAAFFEDKELNKIKLSIEKNKRGFELLQKAKMPKKLNSPKKDIQKINQIWRGNELNNIRNLHKEKKLDEINVCKKCTFKDTYEWQSIKR